MLTAMVLELVLSPPLSPISIFLHTQKGLPLTFLSCTKLGRSATLHPFLLPALHIHLLFPLLYLTSFAHVHLLLNVSNRLLQHLPLFQVVLVLVVHPTLVFFFQKFVGSVLLIFEDGETLHDHGQGGQFVLVLHNLSIPIVRRQLRLEPILLERCQHWILIVIEDLVRNVLLRSGEPIRLIRCIGSGVAASQSPQPLGPKLLLLGQIRHVQHVQIRIFLRSHGHDALLGRDFDFLHGLFLLATYQPPLFLCGCRRRRRRSFLRAGIRRAGSRGGPGGHGSAILDGRGNIIAERSLLEGIPHVIRINTPPEIKRLVQFGLRLSYFGQFQLIFHRAFELFRRLRSESAKVLNEFTDFFDELVEIGGPEDEVADDEGYGDFGGAYAEEPFLA
mmetsp:Transcript_20427/g.36719  ORF Transcript_20427/g.36719 Transcript_20427/m.36719 type:complete len:389 (-) Transcript_20427:196-1362(-)